MQADLANLPAVHILRDGGCYWKRQPNSPGHSLAIPNHTRFRIPLEGALSHKFDTGKCESGWFVVETGDYVGKKFPSANATVNAIREPSTNAFLYIQFYVSDHWIIASDLRMRAACACSELEDLAIEEAIKVLRAHSKTKYLIKSWEDPELVKKAAEITLTNSFIIDTARTRLAIGKTELLIDEEPGA